MAESPPPAVARGLRIEMAAPGLPVAGMEMVIYRLVRQLADRGHDVGVTCIEEVGALGERLRNEGFRVSLVPSPGLRTIVLTGVLRNWFRSLRPDVLHVHSGGWLKVARAGRQAGVPRIIHTVHGLLDREPPYGPAMKRWAARSTDWVVPVSQPLADYLTGRVGLPHPQVRLIRNGVDAETFLPGPRTGVLRGPLGLGNERFLIGCTARLSPVKNHALLLEAFARLHAEHPGAFLVLIGEGALRSEIESRVDALGVRSAVALVGESNRVAESLRDLDLFVLPSRAEGTSMSILEALGSGVCVVATDVGGNGALLAGGAGGMLVPTDDVAALTSAMDRAVRDAGLRVGLAAAGRAHIVAKFSEETTVRRYEALYRCSTESNRVASKVGSACVA
jgi:glycosyltransferase involved in cell wall biosynthesis